MSKKKDEALEKCDKLIKRLEGLKKALGDVNIQPKRNPVNALGVGWSQDPTTGSFHHSTHGIITTSPHPEGGFEIKHGGGVVGRVNSLGDAGARIKQHVSSLGPLETNNYNRSSPNIQTTPKMAKPAYKSEKDEDEDDSKYSPAQRAALKEARKLKKTAQEQKWVRHASVPNADEELAKLNKSNPVERAENMMANQLANMMQGKAMLGQTPPRQPTDQEMFGHLVPSEEQIAKAEQGFQGAINNWLAEASKPISSRFSSPEEEEAYWAGIRVEDRDDKKSGY